MKILKYALPAILVGLFVSLGAYALSVSLPPSIQTNDLLKATSNSQLSRLPVGTNGQVLKVVGGTPAWGTDNTGGGGGSTTTIFSDIQVDGPSFIFATNSVTGLNFLVTGSSTISTITFSPQLQAGYVIPLQTTLNSFLTTTTAASTYYLQSNPAGYITMSALTPYLTTTTAASTYYLQSNPASYITATALVPYLTTTSAASLYQPIGSYLTGVAWGDITGTLSSQADLQLALNAKLSTTTAAATYEPILTKGNLTAVAPLQFDNTRQVIGGATAVSVASGYDIPLTASTTNWNGFFDVPSTRIAAGTNLYWSGNTLNGIATTTLTGGATISGSSFILASTSETNLGIQITCATLTCTFAPQWIGTLADNRIASAATWNAKQNALTFPLSVALGGTGAPALTANDILFGNGANAVATSTNLTWNGTVFTTSNASTTVLTAPTLFLTGLTSTVLAVDPNGKVIATTTSAGGVTSVSGSGSILSSGGSTPTIQLQPLTNTNVLFGLGTNMLGTSTTFTYSTTTNNLFVTNASSTTQTVGTLFVTGQSNLTTTSTTPLTVTGAFYATGSTTLSNLTAGCVNSTSGGALFVAGCAAGGGGGGLGTSTPFSTGYIPMATGTNVTLSNSVVYQSIGNVGIATTTPGTPLYVIGSSTISSLGAGMVQSTAYGALFSTPQTGTGLNVLQTSPTLITPILGTASGTSLSLSSDLWVTNKTNLAMSSTTGFSASQYSWLTGVSTGMASSTGFSASQYSWLTGVSTGNASTTGLSVNNNLWVTNTSTLSSALFVSGRLGVGTTTDISTFSLQGTASQANNLFNVSSSSSASIFKINQNGNFTLQPNATSTTAFVLNNMNGSAILTVDNTPVSNTGKIFQVSTTTPANDYFFAVMGNSHLSASTSLPTISACGTTPSVTGGGDTNFEIQVGSVSATTCTATFARAFTNKPICTVTGQTGTITLTYTISATAVVVTNAALTSDIVDVICLGRQE